jgi:uncharacterized protein YdcH (DUF465 family)
MLNWANIKLKPGDHTYPRPSGGTKLKSEEENVMDIATADAVKSELIKKDPTFRDLVQQHQSYEKRLVELAHLTYPNDDEQLEESTIKKKKLHVKDEMYAMMEQYAVSH